MRDARFCAEALGGRGVIAFHDYNIVRTGIEVFLGQVWRDVSMAVAFNGSVFAVELGGAGILRSRSVDRAIGSEVALDRLEARRQADADVCSAAWRVVRNPHN